MGSGAGSAVHNHDRLAARVPIFFPVDPVLWVFLNRQIIGSIAGCVWVWVNLDLRRLIFGRWFRRLAGGRDVFRSHVGDRVAQQAAATIPSTWTTAAAPTRCAPRWRRLLSGRPARPAARSEERRVGKECR